MIDSKLKLWTKLITFWGWLFVCCSLKLLPRFVMSVLRKLINHFTWDCLEIMRFFKLVQKKLIDLTLWLLIIIVTSSQVEFKFLCNFWKPCQITRRKSNFCLSKARTKVKICIHPSQWRYWLLIRLQKEISAPNQSLQQIEKICITSQNITSLRLNYHIIPQVFIYHKIKCIYWLMRCNAYSKQF